MGDEDVDRELISAFDSALKGEYRAAMAAIVVDLNRAILFGPRVTPWPKIVLFPRLAALERWAQPRQRLWRARVVGAWGVLRHGLPECDDL